MATVQSSFAAICAVPMPYYNTSYHSTCFFRSLPGLPVYRRSKHPAASNYSSNTALLERCKHSGISQGTIDAIQGGDEATYVVQRTTGDTRKMGFEVRI